MNRLNKQGMSIILGFTGSLVDCNGNKIGVKGVGKDTSADILSNVLQTSHRIVRLSFAEGLKSIVSTYYGISRDVYDTPETKEVSIAEYPEWTFRKFLEVFGTDVVRTTVSPNVWCDRVKHIIMREQLTPLERMVADVYDLKIYELNTRIWPMNKTFTELCNDFQMAIDKARLPSLTTPTKPTVIMVTDVRFENEYDMLKSAGAYIIEVERVCEQDKIIHQSTAHVSNQPKEYMKPDYTIQNNSSKQELQEKLMSLFATLTV